METWKPYFFLYIYGTNIVHFSLIVSIATSMYTFTGVPQNVVGKSIVLRDSPSFGHGSSCCIFNVALQDIILRMT